MGRGLVSHLAIHRITIAVPAQELGRIADDDGEAVAWVDFARADERETVRHLHRRIGSLLRDVSRQRAVPIGELKVDLELLHLILVLYERGVGWWVGSREFELVMENDGSLTTTYRGEWFRVRPP